MSGMMLYALFGNLLVSAAVADTFPRICLNQPPAGQSCGGLSPLFRVSHRPQCCICFAACRLCLLTRSSIDNPFNATCEAILVYSDVRFLPISFVFEPVDCQGKQLAQLIVPSESPDGDVLITLFVSPALLLPSFPSFLRLCLWLTLSTIAAVRALRARPATAPRRPMGPIGPTLSPTSRMRWWDALSLL